MIGWGWVVSTGDWINNGGVIGAALGFVIGGIMIFFVGLTYAELTAALPQCGGEHVFSYKAMGANGSFICTWGIIFGYVSVACFEACSLPTVVAYIFPNFLKGYLYTVQGFDIYASWLILAIVIAIFITAINIVGVKTAANMQTALTAIIFTVGLAIIVTSVFRGDTANLGDQMFNGTTSGERFKHVVKAACVTPFYFIGFDVIPQAAEEISGSLKKIGRILIVSIMFAIAFYALIIIGVGCILNKEQIAQSMAGSGLVTADAMALAFNSKAIANVCIIGGICGIVTSWNAFMIGGSRAMYSMADSNMIPKSFAKLHPKYKTPINALLLIGVLTVLSPLAGRPMLVWACDVGNLGCCLAYCMVSLSFVILRKKAPDMPRPYKVKNYKFVGYTAVVLSGLMVLMYIIPGTGATLAPQEWAIAGGWTLLGVIFFLKEKKKYGAEFGAHIDIAVEYTEEDMAEIEQHKE